MKAISQKTRIFGGEESELKIFCKKLKITKKEKEEAAVSNCRMWMWKLQKNGQHMQDRQPS